MSHGFGECLWAGCYADSGVAWGYCQKHQKQGEGIAAQRREEAEARERLRDAAPELLAALEECRARLVGVPGELAAEAAAQAAVAIANARGGK